ncbi:MAG: hypothetical protein HY360_18510 [Verrucomicrobia bacterium]|nr:hypothetical protein [Verrucomicrobiota bacterium]
MTPSASLSTDWDAHPFGTLQNLLTLGWLVGTLLLAIRLAVATVHLSAWLSTLPRLNDPDITALLEECKCTMGIQMVPRLLQTAAGESPALMGLIRPTLLLPACMTNAFTREELRWIFLHELAHLKRRDVAVNWLTSMLQCLHWFNPAIWFAFNRIRVDRESACDALVLSCVKDDEGHNYGRTIIKLLEQFAKPNLPPGVVGILEDHGQAKRRITMIVRFKKEAHRWPAAAMLPLLGLSLVTFTGAKSRSEAAKKQGEENTGQVEGNLQPLAAKEAGFKVQTRIFSVAPGNLRGLDESGKVGGIEKVFEEFGIQFPAGTRISYKESMGLLVATHTPDMLEQIEAILLKLNRTPPQIVVEVRMIEVPTESIEDLLDQKPDHQEIIKVNDRVLKRIKEWEKQKKAVLIGTIRSVAISGESARQRAITEYSYVTDYAVEKGIAKPVQATREVGLILDCKPCVSADLYTITCLTFSFESVALVQPTRKSVVHVQGMDQPLTIEHPDFQKRSVTTSIILLDGATMLLGVFDPFKTEQKDHKDEEHKMLVFLNARLVDASGKPIRAFTQSEIKAP